MAKRSPKGVVTRSYPDWRYQQLEMGSASAEPQSGQYSFTGLYNNAVDGSYLFLYAAYLDNHVATADLEMLYTSAVPTYADQNFVLPTLAGAPKTPGRMARFFAATPPVDMFVKWASGGQIIMLDFGFPLVVLPPSWGAYLFVAEADTDFNFTFWWLAMQEVT